LGGLKALERAWQLAVCLFPKVLANLQAKSRIIVSEITAFMRKDRQTGMAISARLLFLIKSSAPDQELYTLWGRLHSFQVKSDKGFFYKCILAIFFELLVKI